MRFFPIALLGACLLGAAFFAAANDGSAPSHRILVKVDSRNITQTDFDDMGEVMFRLFYPDRKLNEITPQELAELNPLALKELVIIHLVEGETETLNTDKDGRNNVRVTSAEVARYLRNTHLDRLPNNRMASRYARTQLSLNQVVRAYVSEPTPSPRKVLDFYRDHRGTVFTTERLVKVRHIFLNGDDDTVKRKAMRLYEDLRNQPAAGRSEEFARAARSFSEDRFKASGGLLVLGDREGWFPQDHNFKLPDGTTLFPQPMLEGIAALRNPGDVELRKSEKGWHIVFLEDIKGGTVIPYPKVRRMIEDYLGQAAIDTGKQHWLREKTARTLITWNDGTSFPVDKVMAGIPDEQRLKMFRQHVLRALGGAQ
ncbi:MAG: peptidylprolyl isomerase [Planctomycetes bacterium]|nr:peptidylprolyl isomerase [Planctomycetota bacterium]